MAASNSFMTTPVYKLHEPIRPIGKMFNCCCLNFVAINKRKLKIIWGMETLQMSKQTMLREKVTPSQGNTAHEQNNTNITTEPVGFLDWFSYRTRSALCKAHC